MGQRRQHEGICALLCKRKERNETNIAGFLYIKRLKTKKHYKATRAGNEVETRNTTSRMRNFLKSPRLYSRVVYAFRGDLLNTLPQYDQLM